jgi:hypothetical protein
MVMVLTMTAVSSAAFGADCKQAFFGWTASDGTVIAGILANEGVGGKNRRGYQNSTKDTGNFIVKKVKVKGRWMKKKVNCGGTAYGRACASNPGVDMKTLTEDGAVQLYHDNEWRWINGDKWKTQYGAYKAADLGTNLGKEEANIIIRTWINYHNGTGKDVKVNGDPLTDEEVDFINAYTAPRVVPADYVPRFEGDFKPGDKDNTARENFFDGLVILAQMRYHHVTKHNKAMLEWIDEWSARNFRNRYRNIHKSLN